MQVGSGYYASSPYGYVAESETLKFIARAAGGSFFDTAMLEEGAARLDHLPAFPTFGRRPDPTAPTYNLLQSHSILRSFAIKSLGLDLVDSVREDTPG